MLADQHIWITCRDCGIKEWRWKTASRCMSCTKLFNAIQHRAGCKVNYEIKMGRLPRAKTLQCFRCGAQATQYEHRDYSKPLDVQPVCHRCNVALGPAVTVTKPQAL